MTSLLTHFAFKSGAFPRTKQDTEHLNESRYGYSLALFLANALQSSGVDAQEPCADDWGWAIAISGFDVDVWIGVGNYEEYEEGFLCFIEPSSPYVRRLPIVGRKIDMMPIVSKIGGVVNAALTSHEGIRDLTWQSKDEFDQTPIA